MCHVSFFMFLKQIQKSLSKLIVWGIFFFSSEHEILANFAWEVNVHALQMTTTTYVDCELELGAKNMLRSFPPQLSGQRGHQRIQEDFDTLGMFANVTGSLPLVENSDRINLNYCK